MSEEELETKRLEIAAEWEINPLFVNSTGTSREEHESITISSKSNVNLIKRQNLGFIEKYAGRSFSSYEEAQDFMMTDGIERSKIPERNRIGTV